MHIQVVHIAEVKTDSSGSPTHLAAPESEGTYHNQPPDIIGPARETENVSSIESWQLLIPDEMIASICIHTNKKITEYLEKYKSKTNYTNHVSNLEIKVFFGLLLL